MPLTAELSIPRPGFSSEYHSVSIKFQHELGRQETQNAVQLKKAGGVTGEKWCPFPDVKACRSHLSDQFLWNACYMLALVNHPSLQNKF